MLLWVSGSVESVSTEFEFEVDASGGVTETMPDVTVEGATVEESTVLPPDTCTTGLEIAHSDRTITNRCEGQEGAVCEYTCDEGYFSPGGSHVCGADGAFAGGDCLADGTVICPADWHELATACESLALATNAGMPTRTIEESVLVAQEKWTQCGVAECTAPAEAEGEVVETCEGVVLAAGAEETWEESCTSLGCEYTAPVSVASATCDGDACAGEFEIGATAVECVLAISATLLTVALIVASFAGYKRSMTSWRQLLAASQYRSTTRRNRRSTRPLARLLWSGRLARPPGPL